MDNFAEYHVNIKIPLERVIHKKVIHKIHKIHKKLN